jgi:uncharacterized protein
MKNRIPIQRNLLYALLLVWPASKAVSQQAGPYQKIKPLAEKYQPFSFGQIKPAGWLKEQVKQNLDGFTGRLDSLVPDLILRDDIYGKDRLSKKIKSKDVGAVGEAGDWQVQFLWWNSETQSNWWDGYIRSAILTGDPHHLFRAQQHVEYILSTQDADGYLGIYDKELRYKFDNENGELWSKTTLLRGLLAWYEYTRDKKLLTAIERAVKNLMLNYPINASHPFYSVNPNVGGLSHGLAFTDVLENLFRITKDRSYLDYALFCYKDFSEQTLNEDAQLPKLMKAGLMLNGHGVHVYEHVRSLAAAYYASGNPQLQEALNRFLQKIEWATTASGAGVGDEWIGSRKADATSRGYEYCSLHELLHSYAELFIKSGSSRYGDRIEKIFFNAAQGARHPQESSIAYLKTDNSYYMTGGLNGDTSVKHQTRYKYSPVHQDAAVCCVPNAGRIAPYYIQNMWLREGNNLVASLLGPSELTAKLNGKKVIVKEMTAYPFGNTIEFEITAPGNTFDLRIRKPSWATRFSVSENYKEENGFIVIHKNRDEKQTVRIEFFPQAVTEQHGNGEVYFSYGPLVLAHPLKGLATQTKSFPLEGFYDLHYKPEHLVVYQYTGEKIIRKNGSLSFQTFLYNPVTKQNEEVFLQPLGQTILRQTTFKRKIKL